MKSLSFFTVMMVAALLAAFQGEAQLPAFPGAEGAGSRVSGGRGTAVAPTRVFEVTSLYDSLMPGTLRYALNQAATHRTIVFRVSGTIHLKSPLKINKANTTIAGQTAPGAGICLADYPVSVSANNIILRHLRFRLGDRNQNLGKVNGSGDGDALDGTGYKNIIIDHCSMSWSSDEACTFYRGDSLTLQWNIISEPLNYSYHFETGDADYEEHGYGGIWGGRNASFHHNIIAHCKGRMPRFDGSRNLAPNTAGQENADFRNNVIYNWSSYNVNGGEGGNYNIVNNYYKYGPNTGTGSSAGVPVKYMIINPYKQTSTPILPYGKYFVDGNYVDGSAAITSNNWKGAAMSGGTIADTIQSKAASAFASMPVTTYSAQDAFDSVMAKAGAVLPMRDSVDMRIVAEVANRTGSIIDVQGGFPHGTPYAQTVGAWPVLMSTTAPVDTDHDGMPDSWEAANSLNLTDSSDRQAIAANGYTNLENYLNNISSPPVPTKVISPGKSGSLNLFPNPATGSINLSFPEAGPSALIAIYSEGGAIAGTWYVPQGRQRMQVNISDFPKGMYILQFIDGGMQWTSKFLKQ